MTKTTADIVEFNHAVVAAMMKSGQVWMAGCQTLSASMTTIAQAQFVRNVTICRAMGGGVWQAEAMERQRSLSQNTVAKTVEETGTLANATISLVRDALMPMAQPMAIAVEKFGPHVYFSNGAGIAATAPNGAGPETAVT